MAKRGRPPHPDILTPREWEVLELLREGLTNPQIAERMGISLAGARYHVSEILGKLGLESRREAAAWSAPAGEYRPWWASAVAPLAFLWRKAHLPAPAGLSSVATVFSAGLLTAVLAGLGLIAFLLLRGNDGTAQQVEFSVGEGIELPIVLDGDRLGISSLDGKPPEALTRPGDYTGVRYDSEGRLLYVQRSGEDAGFYRVEGGEPELVIPLPPSVLSWEAEWSPDGSRAAWIERPADTAFLRVAEPGGDPRDLGPEGLSDFRWSNNGDRILAWEWSEDPSAYLLDPAGTDPVATFQNAVGAAWSPTGDFLVTEETSEEWERRVVLVNRDGGNRRVLGQVQIPTEGRGPTYAFSPDGRWFAWDHVPGRAGGPSGISITATDGTGIVTPQCPADVCLDDSWAAHPAWSPDGQLLAWSQEGNVLVVETGVWEGRVVAEGRMPVWSPDGSLLAVVRDETYPASLHIVAADGRGDEVKVVDLESSRALRDEFAWSPDGTEVVVPMQAKSWKRNLSVDLNTGDLREPRVPSASLGGTGEWPVLAPDGSAFAYLEKQLTLVNHDGDERLLDLAAVGHIPTDWSEDGKEMLFVGSNGLKSLNLDTEEVESLLEGDIQSAAWSPDRSRVAFIREQRLGVLEMATGESSIIVPDLNAILLPFAYVDGVLNWSPDGRQIAFGDWRWEEAVAQGGSDVYIVDADGSGLRRLTDSPGGKRYYSFSPDGRYLAYVHDLDDSLHLRVIDLEGGEESELGRVWATDIVWVADDEILIQTFTGISILKPDGTSLSVVEAAAPCSARIIGWTNGTLFFTAVCGRGL